MDTAGIVLTFIMAVIFSFALGVVIGGMLHGGKASAEKESEKSEPEQSQTTEKSEPEQSQTTENTKAQSSAAFPAVNALSHEEKYKAMSDDARKWYDEIAAYAAAKNEAKCHVGKNYEEYTVGNRKIVRICIKRGVTVCEFYLQNTTLQSYVSTNKIAVSSAPTVMKITSSDFVSAAKETIDIVLRNIEEEREQKRQLARQRRKQKQANASKENNTEATAEEKNTEAAVEEKSPEAAVEEKNTDTAAEGKSPEATVEEKSPEAAEAKSSQVSEGKKGTESKKAKENYKRGGNTGGGSANSENGRVRKTAKDFKIVK